jgi:hypothetical protein
MPLSPPTLPTLCTCFRASHLSWLVIVLPLVLCHLSFLSCHHLQSSSTSTCSPLITPPHLIVPLFFSGAVTSCPPWLFVLSPLIMPPPPIRLRLCLSLRPSCASCPASCCIASHHTAAFHPFAPLPLIAPLLRFLSGWLLHHLLSCRRLPSACTFASHCTTLPPLVCLVVALPLITPMPPICRCSDSCCTTTSCCTPRLMPLVHSGWLLCPLSS